MPATGFHGAPKRDPGPHMFKTKSPIEAFGHGTKKKGGGYTKGTPKKRKKGLLQKRKRGNQSVYGGKGCPGGNKNIVDKQPDQEWKEVSQRKGNTEEKKKYLKVSKKPHKTAGVSRFGHETRQKKGGDLKEKKGPKEKRETVHIVSRIPGKNDGERTRPIEKRRPTSQKKLQQRGGAQK